MEHDDRMHLILRFVIFSDVTINRVCTGYFIVFLAWRDNRLRKIGEIKTHFVSDSVSKSDHLISNLIKVYFL